MNRICRVLVGRQAPLDYRPLIPRPRMGSTPPVTIPTLVRKDLATWTRLSTRAPSWAHQSLRRNDENFREGLAFRWLRTSPGSRPTRVLCGPWPVWVGKPGVDPLNRGKIKATDATQRPPAPWSWWRPTASLAAYLWAGVGSRPGREPVSGSARRPLSRPFQQQLATSQGPECRPSSARAWICSLADHWPMP